MEIKLSDWGSFLTGRILGRQLRKQLMKCIVRDAVRVSFKGIDGASHSFIDELFGKLVLEVDGDVLRSNLVMTDVPPDIASMIRYTVYKRRTNPEFSTV